MCPNRISYLASKVKSSKRLATCAYFLKTAIELVTRSRGWQYSAQTRPWMRAILLHGRCRFTARGDGDIPSVQLFASAHCCAHIGSATRTIMRCHGLIGYGYSFLRPLTAALTSPALSKPLLADAVGMFSHGVIMPCINHHYLRNCRPV